MVRSGYAADDVLERPIVQRAHGGGVGLDRQVHGTVDARHDVHRDARGVRVHCRMRAPPDRDDHSSEAIAKARPRSARATQHRDDVRTAEIVVGNFEIVHLGDGLFVPIEYLPVEEPEPGIARRGNLCVHAPAFVAIISGTAATAATTTTTSMTSASTFVKRELVLSPM